MLLIGRQKKIMKRVSALLGFSEVNQLSHEGLATGVGVPLELGVVLPHMKEILGSHVSVVRWR